MEHEKEPLTARVAVGLQEKKRVIFIALIALVIVVAGALIAVKVSQGKTYQHVLQWEAIETSLLDLEAMDSEDESWDDAHAELLQDTEDLLGSTKGKGFADMNTRMVQGRLYTMQEDWNSAADAFLSIETYHPKSYLAPVALFNAAASYEEAGEFGKASEVYQRIIDTQDANPMADVVRAYFYLGRVAYQQGNTEEASNVWNMMISMYQSDLAATEWVKLAETMLLTIE